MSFYLHDAEIGVFLRRKGGRREKGREERLEGLCFFFIFFFFFFFFFFSFSSFD
jgi:hypothetical protein